MGMQPRFLKALWAGRDVEHSGERFEDTSGNVGYQE
jgi:hypothetical protein